MNAEKRSSYRLFHRMKLWIRQNLNLTLAIVGVAGRSGIECEKDKRLKIIESILLSIKVFKLFRRGSHSVYYLHRDRNGVPDVTVLIGVGKESWRISQIAITAYPDRDDV